MSIREASRVARASRLAREIVVFAALAGAAVLARADEPSLYVRLGGYDAVSAVVEDLTARLAADPQLGRFWANRGADGVRREHQLIVNFVVAQAGGPLYYTGRDMTLAHVGMRISESDWAAFMLHVNETLDKFKLAPRERTDVIDFMESLKVTMVGK